MRSQAATQSAPHAPPLGQPSAGLFLWAANLMTDDERRLLELLVQSADGCTDALLTAQGFKLDVLIGIVSAEFATAQPECTFAAGKPVERTRVRITEAGRRALADRGDKIFL
jgi:hypothetical protein